MSPLSEGPKNAFKNGDSVNIIDGPYKNTIWPTFERLDEDDPSIAIVSIDTARKNKVKIPVDQLEYR